MPGKATPTAADDQATSGATAVVSSASEQEQSDREVFKRLQAQAESEAPAASAPPEPPRVEPPAESKSPSSPGSSQRQPDESQPSSESAPGATPAGDKPEEAARVRELHAIGSKVLRRDGLTEKAVTALIENTPPDELEAMVKLRQEQQRRMDQLGNQVRDLSTQKAPKADPQDDLAGLSDKQRKLIQSIRDEGDEDRAKLTLEAIRESLPAPTGSTADPTPPAREEQTPASADVDPDARAFSMARRFQKPLDAIADDFPDLGTVDERVEFIQHAERLASAGLFATEPGEAPIQLEEAFREVARIRYGAPKGNPQKRANYNRQRNGQPDSTQTVPGGHQPLAGEDLDREAFRRLAKGDGPDDVRRALTRRN